MVTQNFYQTKSISIPKRVKPIEKKYFLCVNKSSAEMNTGNVCCN